MPLLNSISMMTDIVMRRDVVLLIVFNHKADKPLILSDRRCNEERQTFKET